MTHLHQEPIGSSATTLKNLWLKDREKGRQQMAELLDLMMEPAHQANIDRREELADWVKALFTTEKTFEEFCEKVAVFDKSDKCDVVWTKGFVAYRCKTCAKSSPNMSICQPCFKKGNHEGHDFNIFKTEGGGTCDCGDSKIMDVSGFCRRHKLNRTVPEDVPHDLLVLPKFIMERILMMFLHSLRYLVRKSVLQSSFPSKIPCPLCETLDIFILAIRAGTVIRTWVADFLLSTEYYNSLNENRHFGGVVTPDLIDYHKKCLPWFPAAQQRLPMCKLPDEFKGQERFDKSRLVYRNLLEEFMFWNCRYEFPEHLVLFLLNMLPDDRIKKTFGRYYAQHYLFFGVSLSGALHLDYYTKRVNNISTPVLSDSELAYTLVTEEDLLEKIMITLNFMLGHKVVKSDTTETDTHQLVNTACDVMKNKSYYAIVSDFVNSLCHPAITKKFLDNNDVLKVWMRVMTLLCGMHTVKRQYSRNIDYDPQHILIGYYTERETCASPLWIMLESLQDPSTLPLVKKMLSYCKESILSLLASLGASDPNGTGIPFEKISFHYPMHRCFASFAANAIGRQGMGMQDLDMDESLARRIMNHPLQILCTTHEIQNNMWMWNGRNITTQQLAYRQSYFCTYFADVDLFMLQLCSCYMSPYVFLMSIFDRCRVSNCLTAEGSARLLPKGTHGEPGQPGPDKQAGMLEGAFAILLSVLGIPSQHVVSDKEVLEREVICALSVQSCTHSKLTEQIPQIHDMRAQEKSLRYVVPLPDIIEDLSTTIKGNVMDQTDYSLSDECWPRHDPVFMLHRSLYKKNFHDAHTNYVAYLDRNYKVPPGTLEAQVWPPYKPIRVTDERLLYISRILNCRTLHEIIFIVLYKYLAKHHSVNEPALVMALALLEGTLYASQSEEGQGVSTSEEDAMDSTTSDTGCERSFGGWFTSDQMATNIRHVIERVPIPPEKQEVYHDAMETDDQLKNQPEPSSSVDVERSVVVQESILTMLIKLHVRCTGINDSFVFPAEFVPDLDPPDTVPTTGPNVIGRILLLAASKHPGNRKVITGICPTAPIIPPVISDDKTRYEAERERRKQKATDVQEKLLEEFATKQRRFLEQVEMETEPELPPDPDIPVPDDPVPVDYGEKFHCAICGEYEDKIITVSGSTPTERDDSARSQIMGVIGLTQSASLLGFRTETDDPKPLRPINSNIPIPVNCRMINKEMRESLKAKFPAEYNTFTLGHNVDWEWAPQTNTCGHHVHITCYRDHMKWIKRDESGYIRFEEGIGFPCPLCRQTSNIAIPCNVFRERPAPTAELRKQLKPHTPDRSLSKEDQFFHKCLWEVHNAIVTNVPSRVSRIPVPPAEKTDRSNRNSCVKEETTMFEDEIMRACDEAMEEMLTQNRIVLQNDAVLHLNLRGILQGQLEYDLCRFGGTLLVEKRPPRLSVVKRNIPFGPLCHVLMKIARANSDRAHTEYAKRMWNQLAGTTLKVKESSNCPLLLKDPIALLIELCIAIYPFSIDEFQAVVRVLYNVCLVQSLAHVSCKSSPEERKTWKTNADSSQFDSSRLDCLLGLVVACLPRSLFDDSARAKLFPGASPHHDASTEWTLQRVQAVLEEHQLNFVRIAALFQFHFFENMSTRLVFRGAPPGENELVYLAKYLGMLDGASAPPTRNVLAAFAKWPNSARSIVNQWCKEVETVVVADRQTSLSLLTRHRVWKQPAMVSLPDDYTDLFKQFKEITCPRCKFWSYEPCICLMCGQYVCYKGMCQHRRDFYDRKTKKQVKTVPRGAGVHAKECGNGMLIFQHVYHTTIVVVRGPRSCPWGMLYLDDHGEEDRSWKRGQRLTMRRERRDLLNYQWLNQIFDSSCKGWTRHRFQM